MSSFRCPNCGLLNFAGAKSCKRCKTEFGQNSPSPAAKHDFSPSGNSDDGAAARDFAAEKKQYQQQVELPTNVNQPQNQSAEQINTARSSPFNQNFQPPPAQNFNVQQSFSQPSLKLKSGLAIASLVMGCVGFVLCWGFFGLLSVPGLIMGVVALLKANKKPFEYGGKGFAIAGIVLNTLLVAMLPIMLAIAIPNFIAARRAANEGSAVASIQTLLKAEDAFIKSNTVNRCGDLSELLSARLIDTTLATGEKNGYKYAVSKNASGSCELFATPLVSSGVAKTGNRSFYASTLEWKIRAADKNGALASKNDPILPMLDDLSATRRY